MQLFLEGESGFHFEYFPINKAVGMESASGLQLPRHIGVQGWLVSCVIRSFECTHHLCGFTLVPELLAPSAIAADLLASQVT